MIACRRTLLSVLLLATTLAHAQPLVDIPLTGPDPASYRLPPLATFQAAATIGDVTFVAWGTTRFDADSVERIAIAVQVVRGGIAVGSPRMTTSEAARPLGYVKVIACGDHFLVLWNDVRPDTGLYLQRFDAQGSALGPEVMVAPETVLPNFVYDIVLLGTGERGWRLAWNTGRPSQGLMSRRLNTDGSPEGEPERLLDVALAFATPQKMPGLTLVPDTGSSGVVVHADGRVDPRRLPSARFAMYEVGADTSLISIEQGTVRSYRSMFDSLPVWSVPLPEGLSSPAALGRDSSGGLQIVTARLTATGSALALGRFTLALVRHHLLDGAWTRGDTAILYDVEEGGTATPPNWTVIGHIPRPTRALALCDATYLVTTYDWRQETFRSVPVSGRTVQRWRVDRLPPVAVPDSGNGNCAVPAAEPLERIAADTVSSVRLSRFGLVLGVPTAFSRSRFRYSDPAIGVGSGRLLWAASNGATFRLGELDSLGQPARTVTASFIRPSIGQSSTIVRSRFADSRLVREGERFFLVSSRFLREHEPDPRGGIGNYYVHTQFMLDTPTDTGWRAGYSVNGQTPDDSDDRWWPVDAKLFGHDPARREMVYYLQHASSSSPSLIAVDSVGALHWSRSRFPGWKSGMTLVPLGEGAVLFARDTSASVVDTAVHRALQFAPPPLPALYLRVDRQHFLRAVWSDTLRRRLELATYSTDGRKRDEVALAFPTSVRDLRLRHSRSDGIFYLAYVADGVRISILRSDLSVVAHDSLMSVARSGVSAPDAVFFGRRLVAVWLDARHGGADVYASSRMAIVFGVEPVDPDTADLDTTGRDGERIDTLRPILDSTKVRVLRQTGSAIRVSPNPAYDHITVDLWLEQQTDVVLEVVDQLGRLMRSEQRIGVRSGGSYLELPLALPEGCYTIRARAGAVVLVDRFVVLRP